MSNHIATQGCSPLVLLLDETHTFVGGAAANSGADVPGILLGCAESQIAIHVVQPVPISVIHHRKSEGVWDKIPHHQIVKVVSFADAILCEMDCVVSMFISTVAYDLVLLNVPHSAMV